MKTANKWNFRSTGGKILMGLVLAAMFGSMDAAPSFGADYRDRGVRHDRGRYDHRGRGYHRDRYDHRGRAYYYVRGRRVYRPYAYRERVYVPPPVYYEPAPPPGISIFFPPLIIR
jgi:hypothetical protein